MRPNNNILNLLLAGIVALAPGSSAQSSDNTKVTSVEICAADSDPVCASQNVLEVGLAGSSANKPSVATLSNWLVTKIDRKSPANRTVLPLDSVQPHPATLTAFLTLTEKTDVNFIYRVEWLPSLNVRDSLPPDPPQPPLKGGAFPFIPLGAKDGAKDAAIDFTGSWQTGVNAVPNYAWDALIKYDFLRPDAFRLGLKFTGKANQERNLDPDTMKAAVHFETETGNSIALCHDGVTLRSDAFGFEFERKEAAVKPPSGNFIAHGRDSNIVSGAEIGCQLRGTRFLEPNLIAGVEAGRVIDRFAYDPKTSDRPQAVLRPLFGADILLLRSELPGAKRIDVTINYRVRLPQYAEPFTFVTKNGDQARTFDTRTRHYGKAKFAFTFTPSLSLDVAYEWGSLPPNFFLIRHQVSAGLTVRLKQRP